jgi:hypothetical protein
MLIEGVEYTENTKDSNNRVPSDENDFDTGGDSSSRTENELMCGIITQLGGDRKDGW